MKSKTKLTLLGAAVSCGILASLGTATFAWFTTNNMVHVSHSSITVGANAKNLSVSVTTITPSEQTRVTTQIVGASQTFETEARISDCSSDFGKSFYVKTDNNNSPYRALTAGELPGYVYQVGLTVRTKAVVDPAPLRFSASWEAVGGTAESYALVENIRCAIIECPSDSFAPPAIGDPAKHCWVKEVDETSNTYVNQYGVAEILADNISSMGANFALGNYTSAVTRYFLFSAWMEGTLAEDQDSARGGVVNFNTIFSS